jgi:anti-sigma28 factor (negative regulator of flagellin synthesis)
MKEIKMSVSSQPKNTSPDKDKNTDSSLNWSSNSGFQGKTATMLVLNNGISMDIRMEKVLAVRQQLADGIYSMDKRLDATLDRLLKDINT